LKRIECEKTKKLSFKKDRVRKFVHLSSGKGVRVEGGGEGTKRNHGDMKKQKRIRRERGGANQGHRVKLGKKWRGGGVTKEVGR